MVFPLRIASFLGLTFISTWSIAGLGAYAGIRADSGLSYMLLAAACMLMPALSAIVQQRLIERAPWSGLGLSFGNVDRSKLVLTIAIGAAIIPTVFLVQFVLGDVCGVAAFGHVSISSEHMLAALESLLRASGKEGMVDMMRASMSGVPAGVVLLGGMLVAIVAACTANLPFMLGEELGWRGYLFQATSTWSALSRVLFTGVIWGLWHTPLILMGHNYPGHPFVGIPLMVVFCTLLAFLFDWSRTRVKAVWGPCVLHGIINGSAGLFVLFAGEGHPLVASPVGVTGFIALALLLTIVLWLDGGYRADLVRAAA